MPHYQVDDNGNMTLKVSEVLNEPCASDDEKRQATSTCVLKETMCHSKLGRSLDMLSDDPAEWSLPPPVVDKAMKALGKARMVF